MKSKFIQFIVSIVLIFISINKTHAQHQKFIIQVHRMTCEYSNDYGKNEELYGRVWVLNLRTYGTVDNALRYFKNKEILKIGDGSGEVLKISRDSYITLKKKESHYWNNLIKEFTARSTDKIIVIGELIDRDWNNSDDKLMSSGSVWYKVVDLSKLKGAAYQVDLSFKNSQSKVNMFMFVK